MKDKWIAEYLGFPFNGAHCSPSEEFSPKYSSTSAREKSQLIHNLTSKTDECRDFSEYLDTVKRVEKLILENETIGF